MRPVQDRLVDRVGEDAAIALFPLGALSHHALDLALLNVSGYSYAVFWPLTEYRPPSGDLYLSSDPCPVLVAAAGAALVLVRRSPPSSGPRAS